MFMLSSKICRFHFETGKVLCTYFVLCDMNDVTISHALCIEKKKHCVVIRSIESHSVKSNISRPDNIDGHIIKVNGLCM